MNRIFVGLSVAVLCIVTSSAVAQTAITGQISDSEGAVIAKALVLIRWDPSSNRVEPSRGSVRDLTVSTDDHGMFSARVGAGFYDVFVSAPAFTPVAAKVRAREGQHATVNSKLYIDPLVSKEIGGTQVEGVPLEH